MGIALVGGSTILASAVPLLASKARTGSIAFLRIAVEIVNEWLTFATALRILR